MHNCEASTPSEAYGAAISHCSENELGELWVTNDEYASRVNFCPYCGHKAARQMTFVSGKNGLEAAEGQPTAQGA
jgi:hypothetical protein